MAYGLKYTMRMMAKRSLGEILYNAEIYEKDYVGDSFEMVAGYHPFIMEGMAGTEDQYEPIIGSDFRLRWISNEFDPENFPDFVSTDDRKYHIKIYGVSGAYLVWQGFILNDTVKVRFNTGVTEIEFSCTDGLAMLKGIPYEPTDTDVNVTETLSQVITNCLNKISLPDGYDVYYGVNYYASGLDENDSIFKQAYYPARNWLNADIKYMSCYDVLETILRGFGCKIQMFAGAFWITQPNELFELNGRFFQTNQDDNPATIITRATSRVVKPYDQYDPTNTPFFFQDAIQEKILRKGFAQLSVVCQADYSSQGIDNGTFTRVTSDLPDNWTVSLGTSGTIDPVTYQSIFGFEIFSGSTLTTLSPNSVSPYSAPDNIVLSFALKAIPVTNLPGIIVILRVNVGGGDFWVWRNDLEAGERWDFNGTDGRYNVDISSDQVSNITITTAPAPVSGDLSIEFQVIPGSSSQTAWIGNVLLKFASLYSKRIVATPDTETQYKKEVDIVIGGQSPYTNTTQRGALLDSAGAALTGWYRFGIVENYDSLINILAQQVYNMTSAASINFNLVLRGLYDTDDSTANHVKHIVGLLDTCYIQDSSDSVMSVDGKKYIPASLTFDYTDDTVSGTMLEIKNTEIEADFSDTLTVR